MLFQTAFLEWFYKYKPHFKIFQSANSFILKINASAPTHKVIQWRLTTTSDKILCECFKVKKEDHIVTRDLQPCLEPILFLNFELIVTIFCMKRKRCRQMAQAFASSNESSSDFIEEVSDEISAVEELANDESVSQMDFVGRGSIQMLPLIRVGQKYLPVPCDVDAFKYILENTKYTTESQGNG